MIGQRCVQQQIRAEIESRSLARFIILAGDVGSGRKTLAKEIARLVDADCVFVDKGVDAVREVINQSYKIASEVVYVLDGDNMSSAAKSALLKVTEETPNKARFILVVTDVEHTLPTLVSRARVFRMDVYTQADIAAFAGSEDIRFANYCTNKREVDLLKAYGVDEFVDFVKLVVNNVAEVSSANAFKIEDKIALKGEEDKYDMKIFLQAFRIECLANMQASDAYYAKATYMGWINVTNQILEDLRLSTINKVSLFDKWIFNIRKEVKRAEG